MQLCLSTAQWGEFFSKHLWFAIVIVFLAEKGGIPCCGRPESSSSNIWWDKPLWCEKPNARRLTHLACDNAHSFTHQEGICYQIFELEDSGLPQQGILPISAKKTTTKATDVCFEKDCLHCEAVQSKMVSKAVRRTTKRWHFYWWRHPQWKESFSKPLWFAFVVVFLAEMGRIPCCGRPESSSSIVW